MVLLKADAALGWSRWGCNGTMMRGGCLLGLAHASGWWSHDSVAAPKLIVES